MTKEYLWTLKDAKFTKDKGKVFSCFSGGGGSTMGYKLAGFDVVGNCEIDKKMNDLYIENHKPKYNYNCDIRELLEIELPKELYELDILDGSPPCSSFSMSGNREKDWGKEKKFAEGQKLQVLDTLFFDFINLAKRLKPRYVIAENVKGLLLGNAKKYVLKIFKEFDKAGYDVKMQLLDASKMGVPQRRERVFFIAVRKDIDYKRNIFTNEPEINLYFNEEPIYFKEINSNLGLKDLPPSKKQLLKDWQYGINMKKLTIKFLGKETYFNSIFVYKKDIMPTIAAATGSVFINGENLKQVDSIDLIKAQTFSIDYNFKSDSYTKIQYVLGMSVPPLMIKKLIKRVIK